MPDELSPLSLAAMLTAALLEAVARRVWPRLFAGLLGILATSAERTARGAARVGAWSRRARWRLLASPGPWRQPIGPGTHPGPLV